MALLSIALLIGCSYGGRVEAKQDEPLKTIYSGMGCHIYADSENGVMYVMTNNGHGGTAMTVMLNPDGTPKI